MHAKGAKGAKLIRRKKEHLTLSVLGVLSVKKNYCTQRAQSELRKKRHLTLSELGELCVKKKLALAKHAKILYLKFCETMSFQPEAYHIMYKKLI